MSTFLLVHGAWHGGWCWDKVAPLLENKGHKVITHDLPGHGMDKTPISEVTLQAYTKKICDILDELEEKVFLVGHDMGGAVISQAAEQIPQRIERLIYVAAFLLRDKESLMEAVEEDKESLLLPIMRYSMDNSYAVLKKEFVTEVFYADCPDNDAEHALQMLVPQATAPLVTPIRTSKNFGSVPRVYIKCLKDLVISPFLQVFVHDQRNPAFYFETPKGKRGLFARFITYLPDDIKQKYHIITTQEIIEILKNKMGESYTKEIELKYFS